MPMPSINLNILECKSVYQLPSGATKDGINLNILECKF